MSFQATATTANTSVAATTARAATAAPAGRTDGFLRLVLELDAVVTGVNGIAYLAFPGLIASLSGIPQGVQLPVGAFLLVYALGVAFVATRESISRRSTNAVITLNGLWSIGSLAVLLTGVIPAGTIGQIWIALQALVVALFAALQYSGLRRA